MFRMLRNEDSLERQLSALGEKQRDLGDVTVTTDLDRIDRQVADQLVSMYESDQCRARDSALSLLIMNCFT